MRRIVGRALDLHPARLPIEREPCPRCVDDATQPHGRPRVALAESEVRFSLSRTASLAAVAIAEGCDVGVDVEAVRPANLASLDRHTLSPEDRARIERAPAEARAELFFRSWCRKEAATKAAGIGIVTDLRGIDTSPHVPGPVPVRVDISADTAANWQVWDLPLDEGLLGAVAWPAESVRELVVRRGLPGP